MVNISTYDVPTMSASMESKILMEYHKFSAHRRLQGSGLCLHSMGGLGRLAGEKFKWQLIEINHCQQLIDVRTERHPPLPPRTPTSPCVRWWRYHPWISRYSDFRRTGVIFGCDCAIYFLLIEFQRVGASARTQPLKGGGSIRDESHTTCTGVHDAFPPGLEFLLVFLLHDPALVRFSLAPSCPVVAADFSRKTVPIKAPARKKTFHHSPLWKL